MVQRLSNRKWGELILKSICNTSAYSVISSISSTGIIISNQIIEAVYTIVNQSTLIFLLKHIVSPVCLCTVYYLPIRSSIISVQYLGASGWTTGYGGWLSVTSLLNISDRLAGTQWLFRPISPHTDRDTTAVLLSSTLRITVETVSTILVQPLQV